MERHDAESERIHNAIDRIRKELPHLDHIISTFEDILAEQAKIVAQIECDCPSVTWDAAAFASGTPVLDASHFTPPIEVFKTLFKQMEPVLAKALPSIKDALPEIGSMIESGILSPEKVMTIVTGGDLDEIIKSHASPIDKGILIFDLMQCLKPFAQKKAQLVLPLPENYHWSKGYCPICGSWPELSYLEGEEGHRFLRCSFCGHHYPYPRLQCPFCETDDQMKLELFFAEDRPYERGEVCHECHKYIVSLDLRKTTWKFVPEVGALGLVHLDILAQEKGFEPGAVCGWNLIE